tara:strand:+ start:3816 stop:5555 length:1740 start_codon:yes stop_codon:yes gene_type:complete
MLNIYFKSLRNTFKILPNHLKKKLFHIQILVLFTSLVDLFGFAVFIPVFSIVFDPELLNRNFFFLALNKFLHFKSLSLFQIFILFSALSIFFFRSLFIVYSLKIQKRFAFSVSEYIGNRLYCYYLSLDFLSFSKLDHSQILRELTISPSNFSKHIINPILLLISEIFIIVFIIIAMAIYDFTAFVLIFVTLIPAAFIFQRAVKKRIKSVGERMNDLAPFFYENSLRGVYGFSDVKFRNKGKRIINDYDTTLSKLNNYGLISGILNILPSKLFELIAVIGIVIIFLYSKFILNDSLSSIKLLSIYLAASYKVIPSLSKIIPSLMSLEQYYYLFEIYKKPFASLNISINQSFSKLIIKNEIEIDNVSFSFNNKKILDNISFKIKKAEMLGIIGKSGVGKTTLINIISGLIMPDNGSVKVNGVSLNNQNIKDWYLNVAYVKQEPYLERGTLVENIAFLDDNIDLDRVRNAIEMVSLEDLINGENLENIKIEEFGKNLSSGQKQRIIIARALYNNCNVILFDESTSALDVKTEQKIVEIFKELKKKKVTVIIIAHRFSTLKYTDRIIELDECGIKNTLTYSEL